MWMRWVLPDSVLLQPSREGPRGSARVARVAGATPCSHGQPRRPFSLNSPALSPPPPTRARYRQAVSKAGGVDISISKDVLKAIADAEAARDANRGGPGRADGAAPDGSSPDSAQRMKDSLERIAEQARKLAKDDSAGASTLGEKAIRSEFENLLSVLAGERGVDPADLK